MAFVTMFLCNHIVYGAEVPSGYQVITPTIKYNLGITVDGLFVEGDDNVIAYYFPVYEGMPFGFDFDFVNSMNVMCYGFTRVEPAIGVQASSYGLQYDIENGIKSNVREASYDGYAYFVFGDILQLSDAVFWLRESLGEIIQSSTSTIVTNQNQNTDKIVESQEEINDSLTSTEYDDSVVNIDTSSLDDLDENTDILNYPMQVVQKLSDIVSTDSWSSVDVINITIPYTGKQISLRSDMLYNFIKDSAFYDLLQVFWTYIFGRYLIFFGLRIYHWLRTGEAVRKSFNLDSEAITAALM